MPRAPDWTVHVTGALSALAPHQLQVTGARSAVMRSSAMKQVSRVRHHRQGQLPSPVRRFDHGGMGHSDHRELARRLASLPAFAGCSARDLDDLARHARRSSVPAGWPLIHQETPADACYVILDGAAVVRIDGADVATISAGGIVGEVALATGRLRNATVTSTEPLDLLHVDAEEFRKLLVRRPAVRASLLARLSAATA
jgi:CRP/FNR family transcriptional regulator, cyclic AMP receptor protein